MLVFNSLKDFCIPKEYHSSAFQRQRWEPGIDVTRDISAYCSEEWRH
jgi:hypothetical protein